MDGAGQYTEKQRHLDALPGLSSLSLTVLGFLCLNDCAAIKSLPAYVITFSVLNVANTAYKFYFRIPMNPKLQRDDLPTKLSGLGGLGIVCLAVWGAVITWGHAGDCFSNNLDCNATLFICGLVSSAIPITIIAVVVLLVIAKNTCLKSNSQTSLNNSNLPVLENTA